jgi:D-alanine-D-alanine ligase
MDPAPKIAVAYNAYEPRPIAGSERRSEESVAEMAEQVAAAVRELGWPVTLIPLQRSILNFLNRVKEVEPDVLVNLCEGFFGRPQWEANVAGIFELLDLPFTGSALRTLALCQDKFKAKAILRAAGLPTAPAQFVTSAEEPPAVPFPAIIKPDLEDASLGIYPESVVRDAAAFHAQVARVLEIYRQPAIAEKYIDGREFNVAVMENGRVEALPVSEIDFSRLPAGAPRICSYEAKWFEDHPLYQKTPPICPAIIDDDLRRRLQETAVAAFRILGCRDYARVDFRMDKKGEIFILEVNPNPDISHNAGYARALKAAGLEYPAFWRIVVENARQRKSGHDPADAAPR